MHPFLSIDCMNMQIAFSENMIHDTEQSLSHNLNKTLRDHYEIAMIQLFMKETTKRLIVDKNCQPSHTYVAGQSRRCSHTNRIDKISV